MAQIPLFTVGEWQETGAAGLRIAACRGCGAETEASWQRLAADPGETIASVVARFTCGACGQPGRDNDVYGYLPCADPFPSSMRGSDRAAVPRST